MFSVGNRLFILLSKITKFIKTKECPEVIKICKQKQRLPFGSYTLKSEGIHRWWWSKVCLNFLKSTFMLEKNHDEHMNIIWNHSRDNQNVCWSKCSVWLWFITLLASTDICMMLIMYSSQYQVTQITCWGYKVLDHKQDYNPAKFASRVKFVFSHIE